MNRPIRLMSVGCILLFLALLLNVNYVQAWQSDELNDQAANTRARDAEFSRERGPILVADDPIAESRPVDDTYQFQRRYNQPLIYAHLTGFFSYRYDKTGVELTENDFLSGDDPRLLVNRIIDLVTNEEPQGGSALLTIDRVAQQAAFGGLMDLPANAKGAVVALRPDTGEILAMSSVPTYDPNLIATHNFKQGAGNWRSLNNNPAQPMFNRAIQGRYPPGSTFKLVTSAAALSSGQYTPDTGVTGTAVLDLPQTDLVLRNHTGGSCGAEEITLTQALAVSCNTAFGSVGMDLGPGALADQAERFGFGQDVLDDLPSDAESVFPRNADQPQTGYSAIGQFDVATTPLQMAMVAAGIANDGLVMKPYLISELRSPDLDTVEEADPQELSEAVTPEVAEQLQQMMVEVTNNGTGESAQIEGIEVGSKTGTAERSSEQHPYAWFVSFAPVEDPQVAVAVFVEDANVPRSEITGGGLAGPIARAVMEAVINQ
ncbi:MAG: penicillin-binding protein 2 [Propionibacteriales bacterium]|nr:penicillin-binding protein 2 [Propionibacteriales bacterium]